MLKRYDARLTPCRWVPSRPLLPLLRPALSFPSFVPPRPVPPTPAWCPKQNGCQALVQRDWLKWRRRTCVIARASRGVVGALAGAGFAGDSPGTSAAKVPAVRCGAPPVGQWSVALIARVPNKLPSGRVYAPL